MLQNKNFVLKACASVFIGALEIDLFRVVFKGDSGKEAG